MGQKKTIKYVVFCIVLCGVLFCSVLLDLDAERRDIGRALISQWFIHIDEILGTGMKRAPRVVQLKL